jgi:hypothetical protein
MAACDFTGNFIPQCYVTFFMFQIFKFYLSALPSLPSAPLSEHSLLFLFWSSFLLQHLQALLLFEFVF